MTSAGERWMSARLLRDQRIVHVSGASQRLNGPYCELVADSHSQPVLRKLEISGAWGDEIATFTDKRWRLTADLSATKCFMRSAKMATFGFEVAAWERRSGKTWVPIQDVTFQWGTVADLEPRLQKVARDAFSRGRNENLRLTPYRCSAEDCPRACGNADARTWGLASQAELLGHLTYYHRGASVYHEMINEVWCQAVADELEQREESPEDLLALFEASLRKHRYDLKVSRVTPSMHVKHIRKIMERREVNRCSAKDEEVFLQVKEWSEDRTSHGHYSVSLRWLKKFCEVSALEACVAPHRAKLRRLHEGPTAGETEPEQRTEANEFRCMAVSQEAAANVPTMHAENPECQEEEEVPEEEEAELEPPKPFVGAVARATDPVEALLKLLYQNLAPSRARPPSPLRHELAKDRDDLCFLFARVASGYRRGAEEIASCEEARGPCASLLDPAATDEQRLAFASALAPEQELRAWLWACCGAAPPARKGAVLKALVAAGLRQSCDLKSLNGLLKKLLATACTPFGSPADILGAVEVLLEWPLVEESNAVPLTKLAFFAHKAFVFSELLGLRGSGFTCALVQFASFGGILGLLLRRAAQQGDDDLQQHLKSLYAAFRPDMTLQAWRYRVAFMSALFWNFSPATAGADVEKVLRLPAECAAHEEQQHLRHLQQQAATAAKKAQEKGQSGAFPEERPVATPTRTRNGSPAAAAAATPEERRPPTPRKLQEQLNSAREDSTGSQPQYEQCIRNADTFRWTTGVKGEIRRRSDHAGGSFQLTLHDATGEIHAKFWKDAAKEFREDERLQEGNVIFLRGYELRQLRDRELEFAPAGRKHCLNFNNAKDVHIELLQGVPEVNVAGAAALPVSSRLCLRCFVVEVEDLVEMPNSPWRCRRKVLVADAPHGPTMPWTLFGSVARTCDRSALLRRWIHARNVRVSLFQGNKQLTGSSEICDSGG